MKIKKNDLFSKILHILPFIIIFITAVFFIKSTKGMTPEDILNMAPENYWSAAALLLIFYAMKALSIIFPISVLQISAGLIFPPVTAIVINIIGVTIETLIPYLLGHYSGRERVTKLLNKYPKVKDFNKLYNGKELLFTYTLRSIGGLPMDVTSIMLGYMNINYWKYLVGTIGGLLPRIIIATIMGTSITEPGSPAFIISLLLKILLSIISLIVYRYIMKKEKKD